MSDFEFSEERVLAAAREATGLSDFGDDGFREGLGVLLETYRETADFDEAGVKRNWRRVVSLLATRLRVQAAFSKHPEIREREIRQPMVLTGMPRSGTSALFNLLGADPVTRPLLLWETQFPDPYEGELAPGKNDPRRDAIEAHYARGREKNPEFSKMHDVRADGPEECVLLMAHDFCDVQMGIEPMMEPYQTWFRQQDFRRMYRYYADLLRMLDWQRPGERWLLKAPAHMWAIDVLIETFPDVSIVWSHRDPIECTASICSLTAMLMRARKDFNLKELGPIVMDFYASSLERGLAARDACDQARFIDVEFRDFIDDNLAVARRIYDHFSMPMPPEAEQALQAHVRDHPRNKHGKHEYDLAQYGLTREMAESRFAPYLTRFDLL